MKYRFINAKQLVASYMVNMDETSLTSKELNDYSIMLEESLTNNSTRYIAEFGDHYLKELKREDNGQYFNIDQSHIGLADNQDFDSLRKHIISYMPADTLMGVMDASAEYRAKKEKEELTK